MAITDVYQATLNNGKQQKDNNKPSSPSQVQRRSIRKVVRKSVPVPHTTSSKRQPRYKRLASSGMENGKQFYEFMKVKGIPVIKEQYTIAGKKAGDNKTLILAILGVLTSVFVLGMFLIGWLYLAGYFPTQEQLLEAAASLNELPDKVPRGILPRVSAAITGATSGTFIFICSVIGVSERTMLIFLGGVFALILVLIPPMIFVLVMGLAWLEVVDENQLNKLPLGDFKLGKWFKSIGVIESYDE